MPGDLLEAAEWRCTTTPAGAVADAGTDLAARAEQWWPATVPGTAAGALRAAGHAQWESLDYDASDWWFTTNFVASQQDRAVLSLDGLATLSEVFLDGTRLLESSNMFLPQQLRVDLAAGDHELTLCFRALTPRLSERRPRPRWRTRLVDQQNLRYLRTTLLGRMPGWSNRAAPVGPWRPVRLQPLAEAQLLGCRLSVSGSGLQSLVTVTARLAALPTSGVRVRVGDSEVAAVITPGRDGARLRADVPCPEPELWWPHTHGQQPLYPVSLEVADQRVDLGRVGFRQIAVERRNGGFQLVVNGEPIFTRGACWVPPDVVSLASSPAERRRVLERAKEMGANLVRVPGTMVYEPEDFFASCDELGLLVWQDCMLANLDPPDDPAFVSSLLDELESVFSVLSGHPSVAVICGGSEIEQQAAMAGAGRDEWVPKVIGEVIPSLVSKRLPGLPYVTSSPTGGALPFSTDAGISHYFGVGAYLRPLEDARRADVRFASECLAFAVPPERSVVDQIFGGAAAAAHTPSWKAAVPRDAGTSWDFEDITIDYARRLFGVDPLLLRYQDPERALDLARAAAAHCVERTLTEWRRHGSHCAGAIVLSLRDLVPGAGWGLLDSGGRPKSTWYAFQRAAAPLALLATDEGLSGVRLHLVNERPEPFAGTLRVELYASGETLVDVAERAVEIAGRSNAALDAAALFAHFVDLTYDYRFGPPSHDAIALSLRDEEGNLVAENVDLPLGLARPTEADLGLTAETRRVDDGYELTLATRRLAEFVSVEAPGYFAEDSWFHLAPGHQKTVRLRPEHDEAGAPRPVVHAVNAQFATRATALSATPASARS